MLYLRTRIAAGNFAQDDDGSLLEYALWGALIVVAVMAIVQTLGGKIGDVFNSIANSL
ncbi:Flp family type IVb pilin [Candidatus Parcubacteria bacterium]|nr:MAG: Flp family type IVb pilin [Candidatus Parcubacteria bacterium]